MEREIIAPESSSQHGEVTLTIRGVLDELTNRSSLGAIYIAVESGEVRAGVYSAMRTSPQIMFCVEGSVTYWVIRGGVPQRLLLTAGDVLVLPGGVWVGVDPAAHYRTFGVSLFPELTHCYLVQPGRVGQPVPAGAKSRSFDELRDNVVPLPGICVEGDFERIDYLDELDRPSVSDQTTEQLISTLAGNAQRDPHDPLLDLLLRAVLLRLRETVAAAVRAPASKAEATFDRIRHFIIANCDKPLDRDQIAAAAGVHPRHVSNLFGRFSSETLGAFLLRARLERARRLLGVSDNSVKEVGAICGFADSNHFVRVFRQRFGSPPGQFRRAGSRLADQHH